VPGRRGDRWISSPSRPGAAPVSRLDFACPGCSCWTISRGRACAPLAQAVKLQAPGTPRPGSISVPGHARHGAKDGARAHRSRVLRVTAMAPEPLRRPCKASIADGLRPQARLAPRWQRWRDWFCRAEAVRAGGQRRDARSVAQQWRPWRGSQRHLMGQRLQARVFSGPPSALGGTAPAYRQRA